jgi:ArsR family transcriptional regulator, arsenate/arsenite/antimonite-responsive transcriptional repressor
MALNKKSEFKPLDQKLAEFTKALGHPARIAILRTLAERGTCICGELVEELPLAQSTVSQHLKELKAAGLIRGEVDGPKSCYCIDWDAFAEVWDGLQKLFAVMDKKNPKNCC